jgi:hypothetical protein
MFDTVTVIGAGGRAGSAIAARLRERGLTLTEGGAELVLLCVPDSVIPTVAESLEPGPWVAHVSGATPLVALNPHVRRFSVHPLQTLVKSRGPEQLDGSFAAVTGETGQALEQATWLARTLGPSPRAADGACTLYHAAPDARTTSCLAARRPGCSTTLTPAEALVPLMRRRSRTASSRPGRSRVATGRPSMPICSAHTSYPELSRCTAPSQR